MNLVSRSFIEFVIKNRTMAFVPVEIKRNTPIIDFTKNKEGLHFHLIKN